ncbi:MAG: exo-alpha-sialidase, partial [Clostridia bacterium]|nr:exo-alpha-sialidase [Clostridia bacterium]
GVPDVTVIEEKGYDFLFPDIVKKNDGGLLVVSYKNESDSSHAPYQFGDSLGPIVQVDGSADGKTWGKPRVLVSPEKLAQWGLGVWYSKDSGEFYYNAAQAEKNNAVLSVEARDPNLGRLNDGTLLFTFFTRLPGKSLQGGHQYWNEGTSWYTWGRTYIMYSKDDGATWSAPTEIPCAHLDRNCAKRGNIAVYSDDSILIPLYGMSSSVSDTFSRSKWCTVNVRARLNAYGEWEFTDEYVTNGSGKIKSVFGYGTTEASFGTTADDVTYAMIRYYKYDMGDPGGDVFVSSDKGATWKKIGSTNPNAMQAGFNRMNNGKLFVTWSQTPSPRKIYARVFDTLQPWEKAETKLIYENTSAYDTGDPSGIQLDNGKLLTVFYDTENHHVAGVIKELSFFSSEGCSHVFAAAQVTHKASCSRDGLQISVCVLCQSVRSEVIEAAHSFDGNKCRSCGYDRSENCPCNCHTAGIKKFIFSIINFFEKLFGKNRICACGAAH